MNCIGDICTTTGEYIDQQGQTKKSRIKIGALFQDPQTGNFSILMKANPMHRIGKDGYPEAWLSVFRKDNNNQGGGNGGGNGGYQQPRAPQQQPNGGGGYQQPQQQSAPSFNPPGGAGGFGNFEDDVPF